MGCARKTDTQAEEKAIRDALESAGEPLRTGDIVEKTGLPKDKTSKVLTKMKKDGTIISPKRCFYSLPK